MRAISVTTMAMAGLLCCGAALPLHAEPPTSATHAATTSTEPTHPPRSRIGEVMGTLTQALRDAAEQQSDATTAPTPARAAPPRDEAAATPPLPPDASAQARVP